METDNQPQMKDTKEITVKRLWEMDVFNLFECEVFHHTDRFPTWKAFVEDKDVFGCNCIYGNPMLYWGWTDEDYSEANDSEDPPLKKEHFKQVYFIYRQWFSGMGKILIDVTPEDEPEIRKFIFKEQKQQRVELTEPRSCYQSSMVKGALGVNFVSRAATRG